MKRLFALVVLAAACGEETPMNLCDTRPDAGFPGALAPPVVDLQFVPDVLDFGQVPLGTTSTRTVRLEHNGNVDAVLTRPLTTAAFDVRYPRALPFELPAYDQIDVQVTITPTVAEAIRGGHQIDGERAGCWSTTATLVLGGAGS
ncbi:MAG: hypothetical protein RMA76_42520 [Deltaproteobacteria bacterium]